MKSPLLEVENLMVFYENALAVNNVSLKVNENQIVGLFGMNSAGKSTLFYTIAGAMLDLQKKEQMKGGQRISILGRINYNGIDCMKIPPSERARMGFVLCPERRRIFVESSVLENLKIGGFLANKNQSKETIDYVFHLFPHLRIMQKKQGGFLSGGEQQMLAIGRSLMAQPKLLMLDEPFLGLSLGIQNTLVDAIVDINKARKLTVFMSEQYARPLFPIIDYGYIIEGGAIVLGGGSEELMGNPDEKSAYFGV